MLHIWLILCFLEALQNNIESLPEVERAFVHVDYGQLNIYCSLLTNDFLIAVSILLLF